MNWKSAADFWAMGGYAFFVWGSYVAVAAVLAIEVVLLKAHRRRAVAELMHQSKIIR